MIIEIDTHTHTVLSGHAFGTLKENAQAAAERGLKGFVVSDHGPDMPGASPAFAFSTLKTIPDVIEGVRIVRGIEVNIMDSQGMVDMPERYLSNTEFAIASLHSVCVKPMDKQSNTDAVLAALHNPWIDVIGHPGNPQFPIDYEALVLTTKRLGKLVEINNHSFEHRKGSEPNCIHIMQLCKKHDVPIIVSSDAHATYTMGTFEDALRILEQEKFPEELVLNTSLEDFLAYCAGSRASRILKEG